MTVLAAEVTYQPPSAVAELFAEFAGAVLPRNVHSLALEASHIGYVGACYLISFTVNNTNSSAQYIQLFDQGSVPADAAVPDVVFTAAGSSDKVVSYPIPGRMFERGLVICNSSTAATKTIGSADCFFDLQYVPIVF